jgi:hypothetical protein
MASKVRRDLGLRASQAVCAIDAATKLGLEVRLERLPTVEGLFFKRDPSALVVLGNQRSLGRQAFSCMHEVGHFMFGHGTRIDPQDATSRSKPPDEVLVDFFAAFVLMPQLAVLSSLKDRSLDVRKIGPLDVFRVSCQLGVGYETLVRHLHLTLHAIGEHHQTELLKTGPIDIRRSLLDDDTSGELIILDEQWNGRPVDVRVGDKLLVPSHFKPEGSSLTTLSKKSNNIVLMANRQSICRVFSESSDWAQYVRISNRDYAGLAEFRHLERACDDND